MKRIKKLTALFLSAIMAFGTLTVNGEEQENEKTVYKIVAIGDSTANGHAQDDFGYYANNVGKRYESTNVAVAAYPFDLQQHGFLTYGSKKSYTYLLYDYIQKENPELDVTFTNLAISGLRNTELRALLDDNFKGDSYTEKYTAFLTELGKYCGVENMSAFFKSEIESADLITFDAFLNSFTNYLANRIGEIFDGIPADERKYNDSLSDILGSMTVKGKQLMELSRIRISDFMINLPENMVSDAIDTVMYCLAGCLINFSEIIKYIKEVNPDARILVGGIYNPFQYDSVVLGDYSLDVKSLIDAVLEIVDYYVTSVDPNRSSYSYIDIPLDTETYSVYLAQFGSFFDIPEKLLNRIIDDLFGFDHAIATPLCDEAREEAVGMGLDVSNYTNIYAEDMMRYFKNVITLGDDANMVELILVGKIGNCINYLLEALKTTEVDAMAYLEALSGNYTWKDVYEIMETRIDALTLKQKSVLCAICQQYVLGGIGGHFSEKGCRTKYEAAVKAYEENRTASGSSIKVGVRIRIDGIKGVINLVKSFLKSLFSNFGASFKEKFFGYVKTLIENMINQR